MSTVKANNHQIGQSGTATNNFTLYQPSTPDGTVRLAVGNSGATTGDVLSVSNTGLSVTGTLSATGNVSFDGGTFVFNESGADKDFRIEGDTEPNLFFTDASTDRVGIGTTSPGARLDITEAVTSTIGDSLGLNIQNNNSRNAGELFQIGMGNIAGNKPMTVIGTVVNTGSFFGNGHIFFATRSVTTDTAPTERARITSGGNFFIGNGETAASPSAGILSATGGTGTNIAGANLTIRGGASTGTGAGGVIIFSTAAAGGTSGTATNSATERARITSGGDLRLINSNNIASITQTAITLTGAGGGGTGGQTVNIITANSTTRGVLIVASTQACSAIFFINAGNAVNLSSQTTNETRFSTTSGAGNTANVYASGSNIVLENNIQATRDFYVTFIGSV